MKKNILKMTFIAAVAVASGYIAYGQSQKMETLSDLTMQNVEALASGEVTVGPYYCAAYGYCAIDGAAYDGTKRYF